MIAATLAACDRQALAGRAGACHSATTPAPGFGDAPVAERFKVAAPRVIGRLYFVGVLYHAPAEL